MLYLVHCIFMEWLFVARVGTGLYKCNNTNDKNYKCKVHYIYNLVTGMEEV